MFYAVDNGVDDMMNMTDRMNGRMTGRIFFQQVKGIQQEAYGRIIRNAGGIDNLFMMDDDFWQDPRNVGKNTLDGSTLKKYREKSMLIAERCVKCDINVISCFDPEYPLLLREIPSYPKVLYYKGDLKPNESCVAIVGSRNATSYGHDIAYKLSFDLAARNVCVVSGVARGIDTYAHQGALNARGRTIGVLGCGINYLYPPENGYLYEKISEKGALISEYPPDTNPLPQHFPARNRIISGISSGTVVVEAGCKSGSLITAGMASDFGREVFAVPGDIRRNSSTGTNNLIRDGATPVMGINDIMNVITDIAEPDAHGSSQIADWEEMIFKQILSECEGADRTIVKTIYEYPGAEPDMLAEKTGIDIGSLNSRLIMLELRGMIERNSDMTFRLAYLKNNLVK